MMRPWFGLILFGILFTVLLGTKARPAYGSATITWGTPQQIAGDSDVSKIGILDRAYIFSGGGTSTTINGVTFTDFFSQGSDSAPFNDYVNTAFGSTSAPFANLSSAYKVLLQSGAFDYSPQPPTNITLNDLTPGATYQVQLWVNDSRAEGRVETFSGSPNVSFNTTAVDGGLGQYIIGTFVADSSGSQAITVTAGTNSYTPVPQINGLQLRHVNPITWGTPQQISGDSDVSTTGVLDRAYIFSGGGTSTTINGVTFTDFFSQGSDSAPFNDYVNTAFGSTSAPFANLSSAYKVLLQSGAFDYSPQPPTNITLNNLTPGTTYHVQVWVNDSRAEGRVETFSGSPNVSFNTTAMDGGLGQYIIGTFVADSSGSQAITITAGTNSYTPVPQINGLLLRRENPITWGTPQQISGDSDVSTTGVLDRAYIFSGGGTSTTINGVTFTDFFSQGSDSAPFNDYVNTAFGSTSAPFANLSSAYKVLLQSGAFDYSPQPPTTLTLNNLTPGTTYHVQVWVNDSRAEGRIETISGSPDLSFNTTAVDGGLGQYIIGTFVADSSGSQDLTFIAGSNAYTPVPQVNGLQLRSNNVPAVITGVVPGSLPFGGPATTITINGTGFLPGASVQINGASVPTTYVSSGQLMAQVTTSNQIGPSPIALTVTNPHASPSAPFSVPLLEPSIQLSFTTARDPVTNLVHVTLTFNNKGGGYALNATLSQAIIGTIGATSPALPTPPGTLAPGASSTIGLSFPGSSLPPGANVLKVVGSYTGGTFNAAFRITVP